MKKLVLWILAVIITLSAAVYQKLTGPTYPKREKIELNGDIYNIKLLRSYGGTADAPIELEIEDGLISAKLYYKYFPEHENEQWKTIDFVRKGDFIIAELPNQPMAGKLMYYISFYTEKGIVNLLNKEPVVIRFKGEVPKYILFPHIFFMFFSMLLANVAGLFAIWNISKYKLYTYLTFSFLLLGGMILGPLVQKYAFGELWTGIPFGWDLTDNKTLIAFVFWIIALIGNLKKDRKYLTIIAAVAVLIIFSIPHSMFGSELDRTTGEVTQGFINLIRML
ncbi:MAG: hypothetical protein JXR51_16425 [Bacteroidales bacterium]|nr:hypothetical protein [Bacteroidales bacterium]MBN2758753.1 hypothetical protein [Bacteroidales bacterium]